MGQSFKNALNMLIYWNIDDILKTFQIQREKQSAIKWKGQWHRYDQ